jgi:hypothetical protein
MNKTAVMGWVFVVVFAFSAYNIDPKIGIGAIIGLGIYAIVTTILGTDIAHEERRIAAQRLAIQKQAERDERRRARWHQIREISPRAFLVISGTLLGFPIVFSVSFTLGIIQQSIFLILFAFPGSFVLAAIILTLAKRHWNIPKPLRDASIL